MFTQIRTLVVYSTIFMLLFVLHIVFAANDYHLLVQNYCFADYCNDFFFGSHLYVY